MTVQFFAAPCDSGEVLLRWTFEDGRVAEWFIELPGLLAEVPAGSGHVQELVFEDSQELAAYLNGKAKEKTPA